MKIPDYYEVQDSIRIINASDFRERKMSCGVVDFQQSNTNFLSALQLNGASLEVDGTGC